MSDKEAAVKKLFEEVKTVLLDPESVAEIKRVNEYSKKVLSTDERIDRIFILIEYLIDDGVGAIPERCVKVLKELREDRSSRQELNKYILKQYRCVLKGQESSVIDDMIQEAEKK